MVTRRQVLALGASTAATTFFRPWQHLHVYASRHDKPLRLGLAVSLSGVFDMDGEAEQRGVRMAAAEFNARGGVLGRRVEDVTMDTQSDPDLAPRVATQLIERHHVAFLIGALHSVMARRLSDVAQQHGVIYLNTNSSAASESGVHCHRTKFVWDASGRFFANATVHHAMRWLGRDWFLLGTDYSWGQETIVATRRLVEAQKGRIIGTQVVPLGTHEFGDIVRHIQQTNPHVVFSAIAAADRERLRHAIRQAGMSRRPVWISSQQNWPEIWQLQARNPVGIFATNWYHKLDLPGVSDFVRRYQTMWPRVPTPVPGNVFYNAYMATREVLRAVERTGTTNNIAIIKALEGHRMSAADRMQHHDAWIDPQGHRVQQTIYMATANPSPSDQTDLFEILSYVEPSDVLDPDAPEACQLEPYESIPTFEP